MLRPCVVFLPKETGPEESPWKKALFHCWENFSQVVSPSPLRGGHAGGQVAAMYALAELEDGTLRRVIPSNVLFLDTKHQMDQYDWRQTNGNESP